MGGRPSVALCLRRISSMYLISSTVCASQCAPRRYLTCWVALNDATVSNGCPNVVPAVHRLGARKHKNADGLGWTVENLRTEGAVAAQAKAGSIVVFSSLTPHMTGRNR